MKQLIDKKYLLPAATILMLLVCYQFAFRNTIEEWRLNNKLKTELLQASHLSYQPDFMGRKGRNLSIILNSFKVDTASFRATVVNQIASIGQQENVRLAEVPAQEAIYHTDHFIIQRLKLEGDFFSLLKVLPKLENADYTGFLRSVEIKAVKQHTAKGELQKLVMDVAVEIVKR
jgi:hypothetical protein